jgi:hypothetical protein
MSERPPSVPAVLSGRAFSLNRARRDERMLLRLRL